MITPTAGRLYLYMKANIKFRSRFVLALTVAASALTSSVVLAENVDTAGYVSDLEINESTADAYLQFHGRVVIATSGKGAVSNEYRWGGTSCGTRVLGEDKVLLLQRAMEGGMKVTPRFQDGQGGSKCLVGFAISSS